MFLFIKVILEDFVHGIVGFGHSFKYGCKNYSRCTLLNHKHIVDWKGDNDVIDAEPISKKNKRNTV